MKTAIGTAKIELLNQNKMKISKVHEFKQAQLLDYFIFFWNLRNWMASYWTSVWSDMDKKCIKLREKTQNTENKDHQALEAREPMMKLWRFVIKFAILTISSLQNLEGVAQGEFPLGSSTPTPRGL